MGRHIKIGLDYMSLDCDIFANRKIKLFLSDFPIERQYEVFGIWIAILLKLYSSTGYFLAWTEEDQAIFSRDFHVDQTWLKEIVNRALHRGLFSPERYEEKQVLTSAEITERYVFAKNGHFSGRMDTTIGIVRAEIPITTESIAISTIKSAQRKEKNITSEHLSGINRNKPRINKNTDSSKTCPNGHRYVGDYCPECKAALIAKERAELEQDVEF